MWKRGDYLWKCTQPPSQIGGGGVSLLRSRRRVAESSSVKLQPAVGSGVLHKGSRKGGGGRECRAGACFREGFTKEKGVATPADGGGGPFASHLGKLKEGAPGLHSEGKAARVRRRTGPKKGPGKEIYHESSTLSFLQLDGRRQTRGGVVRQTGLDVHLVLMRA